MEVEVKAQVQKEREISYEWVWAKIKGKNRYRQCFGLTKDGGTSSTDGFSKLHLSNG